MSSWRNKKKKKKKKNQQFSIEKSILSGGMIWYWKDSLLNYANSELRIDTYKRISWHVIVSNRASYS